MRRRVIANDQVQAVIKLRQAGASWLRIEKQTGIARRTAKGAYEDWERAQSQVGLQQARREVIAEEFRAHIDEVTGHAVSLVDQVRLPGSASEEATADSVVGDLIGVQTKDRSQTPGVYWVDREREKRRTERRNRLLFEALRSHTSDEVQWQVLDDWKESWDRCIQALVQLRKEAGKVVSNYFDLEPDLREKVVAGTGRKGAIQVILEGVVEAVWRAILAGEREEAAVVFQASEGAGGIKVTGDETGPNLRLLFKDRDLAESVAVVSNRSVQNLSKRKVVGVVAGEIGVMAAAIGELEEMLDPLVLRALIVRTRCGLCPV